MEALNGVVSNSYSSYYNNTSLKKIPEKSKLYKSKVSFRPSLKKLVAKAGRSYGYEDKGHLEYYYNSRVYCGEKNGSKKWGEVSTKKRMKLLKGLVNDLNTFSDLGFGLDFDCANLVDPVADDKSNAISQAAELLLAQLKQLRAEEEEMKKKEKEDEMKSCKSKDCESSSSSSESSDSECDEVVDMKCMKKKTVVQPIETKELSKTMSELLSENSEQTCCNMILEMTLNKDAGIEALGSDSLVMNQSKGASMEEKKIEVCMGGKCKKLGSQALMDEFQRVMGDEGVVVGCKCLGKCKTAPNVRVLNSNVVDDSLRTPSNAICVGVGLEDVGLIVSNYFGEEVEDQLSIATLGIST